MRERRPHASALFEISAPVAFVLLLLTQAVADSAQMFVFPVAAPRLSSGFGPRIHPIRRFSHRHAGIDLAAPRGSAVRAVRDGRVVFAGNYAGYGNLVTVQHSPHHVSMYGHLDRIFVPTGRYIRAGTILGAVGSTGLSTAPHLHFEWRVDGGPVDPLLFFPSFLDAAQG